ncbi:hypothetical protein BDV40DRAFT_258527 [Aspergillus tamarii]|uniref:Uncharacterized protein n=1 Tax=Aspergillus tamarii TaxID=41984 RepID=A0A5N6V3G8_ASPTM|nr:hypothetical protein BDV40DRAFT_258527 [Aspergillus tamarii]
MYAANTSYSSLDRLMPSPFTPIWFSAVEVAACFLFFSFSFSFFFSVCLEPR